MTAVRCSFCKRTAGEAERIVTGPDKTHPVYICNECVAVCAGILRDGPGEVDAANRFKQRRPNLVPILILAGILYSVWGYYTSGLAKMEELAVVWSIASIIAVLLFRWLRKPSEQINK